MSRIKHLYNEAGMDALKLQMTNKEAIEELKQLEFYGRPFDNTSEESNKANRKIVAVCKAIDALQKLDHINYILNYEVLR